MARPGPRPAVGHLGAPARRPVRARRRVDRPGPGAGKGRGDGALVESYLRAFGPATPAEAADWAGLPIGAVKAALAGLELRRVSAARTARSFVDLPRLPLPDAETPAPPRLLPVWDATLLVHARRGQILPEEHRSKVFSTKTPQSIADVPGRRAGRRQLAAREGQGQARSRSGASTRRSAASSSEEGERLAAFRGLTGARVARCGPGRARRWPDRRGCRRAPRPSTGRWSAWRRPATTPSWSRRWRSPGALAPSPAW